PIYLALESMGEAAVRPPNPAVSEREAMRGLWAKIGLEHVDTQVIRIETAYPDLNDFCGSNLVPIGPQGKVISRMSASAREELRARLRDYLPISSDGHIVYESYANAVKGRKGPPRKPLAKGLGILKIARSFGIGRHGAVAQGAMHTP